MSQYANSITNDVFMLLVLLAIFLITFLHLKKYETPKAALAASFITAIISVCFMAISLVSMGVVIALSLFTAILFIVNFVNS
jgi:heme/copper-type cytochrome/quinol oxidase subunit 4